MFITHCWSLIGKPCINENCKAIEWVCKGQKKLYPVVGRRFSRQGNSLCRSFLVLFPWNFLKSILSRIPDEVIATISCAGFTGCSAKLHKFFISPLFHKYIKCFFKNTQASFPEMTTATEIGNTLFEKFLGQVVRSSFVTWSLSLVWSTQTLTALLQHCVGTATIWAHQCVDWSTFEMCFDR